MKICGIILAKENSNRFPGKNYYEVNGKPMFMHGVDLINYFVTSNNIYIATNSKIIKNDIAIYRELNGKLYKIIDRNINAYHDEQPYLDILRTVYMQLPENYDFIISILANSFGHTSDALEKMIKIITNNNKIMEVRSFDKNGIQSGIFIFREEFLLNFYVPRLYDMGAVIDTGREIHYEEELNENSNRHS